MKEFLSVVCLIAVAPTIAAAQVRTWTDDTGQFTTEAELVRCQDGVATLKTPAGRVISVNLATLSKRDRLVARLPKTLIPKAIAIERARAAKVGALRAAVETVETELRRATKGRVNSRARQLTPRLREPARGESYYEFPSYPARREMQAKCEAELKQCKDVLEAARKEAVPLLPPLDPFTLATGDGGVLGMTKSVKNWQITVLQVIDGRNVIVECSYDKPMKPPPSAARSHSFGGLASALQRAVSRATTYTPEHSEPLWIRGVPTKEFSDRQRITLDRPLLVAGTQQYRTVAGSLATVFRLEPLDESD